MSSEDQGRDQPKRARIEQHRLDQDRTLLAMHQLEAALSAAAPGREATWRDDVLAHLRRSVRRPPRRPRTPQNRTACSPTSPALNHGFATGCAA